MNHSIVCFTTFNPRYPTHWVIAFLQLITRQRYWWIVHCAPLIRTPYGQSTVEIRWTRSYLKQYQPDEYRELYFPAFNVTPEHITYLLCSRYWLNCADITLQLANVDLSQYPTPARVYESALRYTQHRACGGTSNPCRPATSSSVDNQGDNG
jgi:hypothetical protein